MISPQLSSASGIQQINLQAYVVSLLQCPDRQDFFHLEFAADDARVKFLSGLKAYGDHAQLGNLRKILDDAGWHSLRNIFTGGIAGSTHQSHHGDGVTLLGRSWV